MSQGTPFYTNVKKSPSVHLMVGEKYVEVRTSPRTDKAELVLVECQEKPEEVLCYTSEQVTGEVTKKCVAFHFKYNGKYYSPKGEERTIELVESDNNPCSFVHDWWEKENIQAGESHYLRTTAGKIGVEPKSGKKLCVRDSNPVIFTQE